MNTNITITTSQTGHQGLINETVARNTKAIQSFITSVDNWNAGKRKTPVSKVAKYRAYDQAMTLLNLIEGHNLPRCGTVDDLRNAVAAGKAAQANNR